MIYYSILATFFLTVYGIRICKTQSVFPTIQKNLWTDKKIISLSPAGFKGFYVSGIVTYIKEQYSLDTFVFSGASAGAWNALFFTFKRDPYELLVPILENNVVKSSGSIQEIEKKIKECILSKYTKDDFDLQRLYIGITVLQGLRWKTKIVSDFTDLEDAIEACIASSHIPFITGGFLNKYHNVYSFDGGFSRYPYLHTEKPTLHISPSLWKQSEVTNCINFQQLLIRNNSNFVELFDNGYNDAKKNKLFLDSLFSLH